MAVLPLVLADNPLLREKSKRVSKIDSRLEKLIDDMVDTMHATNGVGLAAPQVGVSLRIAVVQLPEDSEDPMAGKLIVMVNPEVVRAEGEDVMDEGCLSVPGYVGKVQRANNIVVKAQDRQGKPYRLKAQGFLAEALQHEIDHLNGHLFFDRLAENEVLRKIPDTSEEEES